MTVSSTVYFCIVCGREFHPRDAETVICPSCGGPPEAAAPAQPVGTVLMSEPKATEGALPSEPQGTVGLGESPLSTRTFAAETDVPLEWNEGDVILDLYEVKGELGRGGMGAVYRVHHKHWNLDLAVKTPLPAALEKAGGKEAFVEEAAAWVKLGLHPHIVTCYYVRDLGGAPRVFAECVEGGSLRDWIHDRRLYAGGERQALRRILDVAIQFAWGLGYAHDQGMVHQDVKPANALMTPEGALKVTDFGLVKSKGYTQAYAAPEQVLGKDVDARTDIWCWGASVLEMFTGEVYWQSGSAAATVLEKYLAEAAPEGMPRMPAALAALLRECFQDEPERRPASMDAVAGRLMEMYRQETGEPYPREKPNPLELRADSLNNYAVSMLDLGREAEAVRYWQEALQA
ncbi:protein kinase, partial [Thermogutta sp.]|uniref:serine/threonine-protein kinase n=1 Tax=Thermogutta sp. TaxID=1962930 RepID=UPI00321FE53C